MATKGHMWPTVAIGGMIIGMNTTPQGGNPPTIPIAQVAAQMRSEGHAVSLRTLRRWADTGRVTKYVDSSGFVYLDPVEVRAELHIAPASEALS